MRCDYHYHDFLIIRSRGHHHHHHYQNRLFFPLLTSREKLGKIEAGQCRDLNLWLAQAMLKQE